MSCWYAQSRGWRGLLGHTISTGPPLIQREGLLDVQVGVARRLSHRYRDRYNTLTQGLARTCAVPPVHCVLAELSSLPPISSRPPNKKTRWPGAPWPQRPALLQPAASRKHCKLPDPERPDTARKIRTRSQKRTQSQNKPFAIAGAAAAERDRSKFCSANLRQDPQEALYKISRTEDEFS